MQDLSKFTNLELLQILKNVKENLKWKEIEELVPQNLHEKYKKFNRDTLKLKEDDLKSETPTESAKKYIVDLIQVAAEKYNLSFDDVTQKFQKMSDAFFEEEIHEFACFYWQPKEESNSKIGINYIKLTKKKNGEIESKIRLLDKSYFNNQKSQFLKESKAELCGKNLFLNYKDDKIESVQTQVTLFVGQIEFSDWSFIIGTYSTVGRFIAQEKPIAGLCILQKIQNIGEAKEFIENPDKINPNIYSYLHKTRVAANRHIYSQEKLPTNKEIQSLKGYIGIYKGNVLTSDRISHKQYLETFYLAVKPNSEAVIKVIERNKEIVYFGRFRVINELNRSIIALFDYKDETKVYRLYFHLNSTFYSIKLGETNRLYGIYSGAQSSGNYPISGNVLLDRISEEYSIELFDSYKPEIKDTSDSNINESFSDKDKRYFFTSNHENNYIERFGKTYFNNEIQNDFGSGDFIMLCLSSNQNSILKYPLTIDSKAKEVRLKGKEVMEHIGKMEIGDRFLSITFINPNIHKSEFAHKLFAIGDNTANNLQIAYGVATRIAAGSKPTARVEVILRSPNTYQNEEHEEFPLFSEAYKQFNLKYNDILNYLSGKYNRLVVASDEVGFKDKTKHRNKKHGNMYFGSACYWARKDEEALALDFLYQAYWHGFKDKKLLDPEIQEGGSLFNLYQSTTKGKPEKSGTDELTCKQIVEKIMDEYE